MNTIKMYRTLGIALLALPNAAMGQNVITGGPGNSTLVGTIGPDVISDPSPNDFDTMSDDGLIGSDGETDYLNARDGDNNDFMTGGPEDHFLGDPGDWVKIEDQFGTLLWQGPFSEYQRIRRLIHWVQNILNPHLRSYPYDKPSWFDLWWESLASVRSQLGLYVVAEVGVDLDLDFPIADGELTVCDTCEAPCDFWDWMPVHPEDEGAGQSYVLTAEEFTILRDDVDLLLAYLMSQATDPDQSDDQGGDEDDGD